MSKKTPFQQVKEEHGDKEKLVDKLVGMVTAPEGDDDFRGRLLAMANSKLLRLYAVHAEIKERFGDKEKLTAKVLELMKRAKDKDYGERLKQYTPVRLLAVYRDWEKKARKAAKKAA